MMKAPQAFGSMVGACTHLLKELGSNPIFPRIKTKTRLKKLLEQKKQQTLKQHYTNLKR